MDRPLTATGLGSAAALLLAATLAAPPASAGRPPPPPVTTPGQPVGEVSARWIAPYVLHVEEQVAGKSTQRVRWFAPDGSVARELTGRLQVEANQGFVFQYTPRNGGGWDCTVHAVNANWRLALPRKPGPSGYITGTADSHTFVQQHHPQEGQIAADVYVGGKRVSTLGPFEQYQGRGVQLAADGTLAFLAWKDRAKELAQVIVAGRDGKLSFQADCPFQVTSPAPAPDGAGVLVQPNFGEDGANTFVFVKKTGETRTMKFWPNPRVAAWVPGTCRALIETSFGHEKRFLLADCATGKTLWGIDDPVSGRDVLGTSTIAVTKDYVLLGGTDQVAHGEERIAVRSLCAVGLASGKVVARWRADPMGQGRAGVGRFCRLGKQLFLVSERDFARLDLADIAAKRRGWR